MTTILAIPPPGVAIFPEYLSDTPLKLILKGESFSRDMTINLEDGRPLFKVEGETFSMSHRRAISDARTGNKLYEVRKGGIGTRHYYAETIEDGPLVFECKTRVALFHRSRVDVTFANQAAADQGCPILDLELTPATTMSDGSLSLNGQVVAVIEKLSLRISGEYHMSIAPGLDPSLVAGIVVMMIDQAKTRAANRSS